MKNENEINFHAFQNDASKKKKKMPELEMKYN